MIWWLGLICGLIGYFLGSVSVSVILSVAIFRSDVRKHGSGNAGATNMARVYGLKGGLFVLLGDIFKAFLSMGLAYLFCYLWDKNPDRYANYMSLAGAACLIGHAFPIYFSFKGGKCVTVGAAIALMVDWRIFLLVIAVFIVVFIFTHIVSISSMCAALGLPVLYGVFTACNVADFYVSKLVVSIFAAALIIVLHYKNIGRLLRGEEKKFTFKKKEKQSSEANGDNK